MTKVWEVQNWQLKQGNLCQLLAETLNNDLKWSKPKMYKVQGLRLLAAPPLPNSTEWQPPPEKPGAGGLHWVVGGLVVCWLKQGVWWFGGLVEPDLTRLHSPSALASFGARSACDHRAAAAALRAQPALAQPGLQAAELSPDQASLEKSTPPPPPPPDQKVKK